MKIHFYGDIGEVAEGIKVFSEYLGYVIDPDGIPLSVKRCCGVLKVSSKNGQGMIEFDQRAAFFRGLGLFVEHQQTGEDFCITEHLQFQTNGIMIDVSRNAVLRVDSVKKMLRFMALMGLNMLMLYMEDTYTLANRPYFGYMRGRYQPEELKACDDYADSLGIEMIPCIQTLGHLAQALKWSDTGGIKDNEDILLAGEEKTYAFIEEMIKSASSPFRSRRIHIGMDEAYDVGLGNYLRQNGYRRRFDIMKEHLDSVLKITEKHGLRPMIWSDMFFRLASKTGKYYDLEAEIPEDVIESVQVQLVYWDYYHTGETFYRRYLQQHNRFKLQPLFAGGIWTWNGISPDYTKTWITTHDALSACKKEGVSEVFATLWGDNGNETNVFSALAGLQLYAEHGYAKQPDEEQLRKRFAFCTGSDFQAFWDLRLMDQTPGTDYHEEAQGKCFENREFNPSKYLLWQDVLIGLFDRHAEGLELNKHYAELGKRMERHAAKHPQWRLLFDFYTKLCAVLSIKSELGIRIKAHYDTGNLAELALIAKADIPTLIRRVSRLQQAHQALWFETYRPFGWEVIDMRYGGLIARLKSAKNRLINYTEGSILCIEELEQERLYYDGRSGDDSAPLIKNNVYERIVTACSTQRL